MTETLAHGYSSESTHPDLFIEYQHDKVLVIIKNLCNIVLWMKVASVLEGLIVSPLPGYESDSRHMKK